MNYFRLKESYDLSLGKNADEILYKAEKFVESTKSILLPKIEAIHSAVTLNNTFYQAKKLKGQSDYVIKGQNKLRPTGIYSWITPYQKPVLINHDLDVDPLGRVLKAEFKTKLSNGVAGQLIYPEISDEAAIEKVLKGLYQTVSIGTETDSACCSVCGKDWVVDYCDHSRGRTYEGKQCFLIMGNLWHYEISFVNQPADENARIIDVGKEHAYNNNEGVKSSNIELLIHDLKTNRIHDLSNDKVFVLNGEKFVQIPEEEFRKEYFYYPFNSKLETVNSSEGVTSVKDEKGLEIVEEKLEDSSTEELEQKESVFSEQEENGINKEDGEDTLEIKEEKEEISEEKEEASMVTEEAEEVSLDTEEKVEDISVAGSVSEIEMLNKKLSALEEMIANFIGGNKEATNNEEVKEEVAEESQDNKEDIITELELQVSALKEENLFLQQQLLEIKEQQFKEKVNQIIEAKIKLGDIEEESISDEISVLLTRSEESLNDAIVDLKARVSEKENKSIVEKISNPTLADNSDPGVFETSLDIEKKESKVVDPREAMFNLLKGKKL